MNFQVRPADGSDAHHIIDIDLKCFDDPWPSEMWTPEDDFEVIVATYYHTPIALAAYRFASTKDGDTFVSLMKLAVKEPYRRKGVATMLLDNIQKHANDFKAGHIMLTVPASLCCGPGNIAEWLAKSRFKAVGIHEAAFQSYGEDEDGYLFIRECK